MLTLSLFLDMTFLKRIFDFYLRSSIHVAFSVLALVKITQYIFGIYDDWPICLFAFFGTIVGYNFVKYDALARRDPIRLTLSLKAIAAVSFCALLAAGYYFFCLLFITQIVSSVFLGLTLLYTLPFFPNRRNARNWTGIKIYIVALCWVGVTLVLPLLNAGIALTSDLLVKAVQRFILVFVLILIFEIIDLAKDDPHLQTVPQQIGLKRTKILGICLMLLFCLIELLRNETTETQLVANIIITMTTATFLLFANPQQSKYYTAFWVESIPIFWYILILFIEKVPVI